MSMPNLVNSRVWGLVAYKYFQNSLLLLRVKLHNLWSVWIGSFIKKLQTLVMPYSIFGSDYPWHALAYTRGQPLAQVITVLTLYADGQCTTLPKSVVYPFPNTSIVSATTKLTSKRTGRSLYITSLQLLMWQASLSKQSSNQIVLYSRNSSLLEHCQGNERSYKFIAFVGRSRGTLLMLYFH